MTIDTSQVLQRFQTYSGLDESTFPNWEHLCSDAVDEINLRLKTPPTESSLSLLVTAAASLAFYRYSIIQGVNELSFKAGDLSVTPKVSVAGAKALWEEAEEAISSLLLPPDTCFSFMAVKS